MKLVETVSHNSFSKTYPYIGIHKHIKDIIILFTSPDMGLCLRHSEKYYTFKYCGWTDREYERYNGKIELSN